MTTATATRTSNKEIGLLIGKTRRFLYISLPSLHDYGVKMHNLDQFLWRTV